MNTSWWRTKNQLDDIQKDFIKLPMEGKYLLSGPPGSGKTNLLLLRAEVMVGSGEEDVLFITYTNTLADFIRSGAIARDKIGRDQIKTFHSWAAEHVRSHLDKKFTLLDSDFDELARAEMLSLVLEANNKRLSEKLFSAIFIDEAQDLTEEELSALIVLSDKVCICGDDRQGIYQRNGMGIAKRTDIEKHVIKNHFRMGMEIAKIADKLMPPAKGMPTLESTCNYNQIEQGASTASHWPLGDRDSQFEKMIELIRIQLIAFKGDTIGVLCAKRETREDLLDRFDKTDLSNQVFVHGLEEDASFSSDIPIHVLTLHGSKGTEFRCVHIFAAEELANFPLNRTTLSYTGVTRAKTALNVYHTGKMSNKLENAFAKKRVFNLDDLLPDE